MSKSYLVKSLITQELVSKLSKDIVSLREHLP